ncbi:MAG: phosphoadenylyl-sulfate reductase [Paracoccaceae bacterium]
MPRELDIAALNLAQKARAAETLLGEVLNGGAFGRIALVSSFGAESAVLLHLVSRVKPDTPVIFLDTQMLFQETLEYQLELSRLFGLSDVRRITPDAAAVRRNDVFGRRHLKDTDGCCNLRKVLPLERALSGFDGWITGRKRHQAASRAGIDLFEGADGRLKVNPLAHWETRDVQAYFNTHDVPRHPLVREGYASIGCAPCTTPVGDGEDLRAGRWRDSDKTECGIHFGADGKVVRPAA